MEGLMERGYFIDESLHELAQAKRAVKNIHKFMNMKAGKTSLKDASQQKEDLIEEIGNSVRDIVEIP